MQRCSNIDSEGRIFAKGLVQRMLEIPHVFEILIGRTTVWPNAVKDLLPKLLKDPRILREFLETKGQRSCCCISSSEKH